MGSDENKFIGGDENLSEKDEIVEEGREKIITAGRELQASDYYSFIE